ncbi:hypothetical protein D3P96_00640 [Weissella viridescens]|uniref:Uncharacterized protein n=1 Tax=Weissella viridescens TaxID=1629 RepID=A0A3P2RG94_WEIVI|nr:hypothetical protein [Weissella viridescens]RRG18525.1 hypothetical protein D3P96_00640 [Weissella viridescens]
MSQYLIIGNSDFFEDANVSYWDCYLDKSEYVGPHKMLQFSLKGIFCSLKQEKRLIDGILLHMRGQMWLIKAEEFSIPGEMVVVQQGVYKLKKSLKPMAEELRQYTPHLHDALLVNDNHSEGVMIADCQTKEDYYALAKSIERVLGKNDIFKGLPFKIYPSKSQIGRVVLERGECIF